MSDIDDRLDRLESLVEQQQETIEAQQATIERQRERIDELEGESDSDDGGDDTSLPTNRRNALKAGGILALLFGGVGTASADSQGQVGTSSDSLETLYTDELNGGVTGDQSITDLLGDGLTVSSDSLAPDLGNGLGFASGKIEVPTDSIGTDELDTNFTSLVTLVGSPVTAGAAIDLDGNDLKDSGTTVWDTNNGYIPRDRLQTTENVVVVAKSGGDYTSVNTALSNVTGPALVWVAPGEYDVTASPTIPADVSLVGANRRATTLYVNSSANNGDPAIRAPNNNTAIRSLRIEWRSGSSQEEILRADASESDLLVDDVHIEDTGGSIIHALGVGNGTVTVENSEIRQTTEATEGEGIQVYSGTLTVRNCVVRGEADAVDIDSGATANLANNQIIGGITNNGTLNKFHNYDMDYTNQ